jgi:hypothetical protein
MKRLACVLLALVTAQAVAQEGELVEGKVYRCEKDGTRYYRTTPMEGTKCAVISYHYKGSPESTPESATGPTSSDWKLLTISEEGSLDYRPKDVRRSGDQVTFWLLSDYPKRQFESGVGAYQSSIARKIVGCRDKTYQTHQTTYYANRYGKGSVVQSLSPIGTPRIDYATPESVGEAMVEKICEVSRPKPKTKTR